MEWMFFLLLLYLAFNGILQVFFVWWVLDRNKKLTLLLVEHHKRGENLK
jgi:hypothetical protein